MNFSSVDVIWTLLGAALVYFMQAGESAPVYKVSKMTYSTEAFPNYKETGKLYKILYEK